MAFLLWLISSIKDFTRAWRAYPQTMFLIVNKKARKSANYIDVCYGCILAGLTLSFIPFRYVGTSKLITVVKQSGLISDFHYLLHLIWCFLQVYMGFQWYSTAEKRDGDDPVAKENLIWQRIVYFYYPSLGAGTIPIIYYLRKRSDELKPLIIAPFKMEKWCMDHGAKGYVTKYLLGVATFVYASCFLLPFIYFVASILRPCLPFVLVSLLNEGCAAWGSPGTVRWELKVILGLYDSYAWVFLPGVYLGIGWISLVYPGSASTRRIEVIAA